MTYFNYHSHKIYYKEMGNGTPLLLLHGNTASSKMFEEIAAIYAKDYKVILIDFLGCGNSDHIFKWEEDLWYDEAMQVITFLDEKGYRKVNIIGTSGGALAAINVALERPDLVSRLIADSFEGECANPVLTQMLRKGREASKQDANTVYFYKLMNGEDWESVIDSDTEAVIAHAEHIIHFFHKPISMLKPEIMLTGSKKDPFFPDGFYEKTFDEMLKKLEKGTQYLFEQGGHPAMLSNQKDFISVSKNFFEQ